MEFLYMEMVKWVAYTTLHSLRSNHRYPSLQFRPNHPLTQSPSLTALHMHIIQSSIQ
jgi:hypothetical protein